MTGDPVSHHSDPRRRRGAFAPPVDALAAAVHLELGADAMRAHVLERGPAPVPAPADPLDDDPPTGLLDLNAIRAAVAAGPIRSGHVDPAAAAWLAGASGPDALAAGRIVGQLEQLDPLPVAELLQPAVDRLVADGHVDPAVADEFAAQVAVDLVEMLDEPEPEPDHCGECHPELYRARCADGGCVAQSPEAVTEAPEAEPVVGGSDLHVYELSAAAPRSVMNAGGRVLDWVSRHDPRSLAYAARAVMAGSAPLADRLWPVGAVLDQQAEGACVGFGIVDALNAAAAGDVDRAAADALELYHDAQRVDDVPGENYSGTSVLAGLKAARSLGWLGGFRWCFGTRGRGIAWPWSGSSSRARRGRPGPILCGSIRGGCPTATAGSATSITVTWPGCCTGSARPRCRCARCSGDPAVDSAADDRGDDRGRPLGAAAVTGGGWCWRCYRYTYGCLHP
jgi:hypothetical protein